MHPDTQDEYTLATEIDLCEVKGKSLLEQYLWEQDFTVNAMAQNNMGRIIDPYDGKEDLKNKLLRHIHPLSFSLSPIRVLRGASLASKLGFSIFPDTLALMKNMVSLGYLDNIHPNRLWKEISRGLAGNDPDVFWGILNQVGFWERFTPAVGVGEREEKVLEYLHKTKHLDLDARYGAMVLGMWVSNPIHNRYAERLGVPKKTRDFANILNYKHYFDTPTARSAWVVIKHTDAIRNKKRFEKALLVSDVVKSPSEPTAPLWQGVLQAIINLDLTPALNQGGNTAKQVENARKDAIKKWFQDLE